MPTFTESYLYIGWDPVPGASQYRFEIRDTATLTLRRGGVTPRASLLYRAEDATADGGPWRDLTVRLWAQDAAGNESLTYTEVRCINPQAGGVSATAQPGPGSLRISISPAIDPDIAGYRVWLDTTAAFPPSAANLVHDGPANVVTLTGLTPGQTYYVKAAAYDVWGDDGITVSSEVSATPGDVNAATAVSVSGGTVSGLSAPIAIADGGTGATTAAAARAKLGITGASGTFTAADGKTVTVTNGLITNIA